MYLLKKELFFLILMLLFVFSTNVMGQDNILVLHSFHQDYVWEKEIQQGIEAVLDSQNKNVYIEYMDAKRNFDKLYFENIYKLYKYKYKQKDISVIIAVDDNALDFLQKYRDELFPNIPIIFSGVDEINTPKLKVNNLYYGVNENQNIGQTVKLAFKLHPKRKQVVAFFANNLSGENNKNNFINQLEEIGFNKNYKTYQVDNTKQIKNKLKKLEQNSIIFLGKIIKNDSNEYTSLAKTAENISKYNKSPIYSSWEFYLNHGVIGGKMINGYSQGKFAAKLAVQVLNSKLKKGQNNKGPTSQYIFDYKELKKFNINLDNLPDNSKIINAPKSFYDQNKSMIWIIGIIIIILITFLLFIIIEYKKTKEELEIEEERLRFAIQGSKIEIWDWNVKDDQVKCSWDFMSFPGYDVSTIDGYITTLKKKVHPQDREEVIKKLTHDLQQDDYYQAEYRLKTSNGWKWILDRGEVVERDNSGDIVRVTGTYQDISVQKSIEHELKRTTEKLENIFAHNNIVFFSIDMEDEDIIEISSSCEKVYGYPQQEFYDNSDLLAEVVHPDDEDIIKEKNQKLINDRDKNHLQLEYRIITYDGEIRWVEDYTIPVRNYAKKVIRLDGIITDITERKEVEQKLKEHAYYDSLTGVYNRHSGLKILQDKKDGLDDNEKLSVCFIDVNNLKLVNDNYGHKEGDKLIRLVAKTISREIRDSDKLIRLGGDEFLICLPDCNIKFAEKIWSRIDDKFAKINEKTNKPYQISASHGIAEYHSGKNVSVEELITIADEKMYEEKKKMKKGRNNSR